MAARPPPVIRSEDVIIHGDFVQFHAGARCEACQARNLKCALQESDDGCMSCAGAGRDCVFARTVTVTGPKRIFGWNSLTAKEQGSLRLDSHLNITEAISGAKPEPIIITPATTLQPQPLFTPEPSSARLSATELPSPALKRFDEAPSRPDQHSGQLPPAASLDPASHLGLPGATRRDRSDSGSDRGRARNGLDPIRRDTLGDQEVPSIADQARHADLEQKNAQIFQWLEQDSSTFDDPAASEQDKRDLTHRQRTQAPGSESATSRKKSFGNGSAMELGSDNGGQMPESPPAPAAEQHPFEREAGSASPSAAFELIDAHPWIEPLRFPSMPGTISQPATSNAAMVRFLRCADTVEAASHTASEGEHGGFLGESEIDLLSKHPGILSRLSLGPPSMLPPSEQPNPPMSAPPMNRVLRPKPPSDGIQPFETSPTLARARTTPIAPSSVPILDPPRRTSTNRPSNYTSRWATVNASPKSAKSRTRSTGQRISRTATELSDDMEDTQSIPDSWAVGELSAEYLQPTVESFQKRIREREPRIEEFLLERLTKEQLHRYKGLVDLKGDHAHTRQAGHCSNGAFCVDSPQFRQAQGAEPEKTAGADAKEEDGSEAGYAVEAALFPPGVPLPPVKRLPAELECPFCFTVRTFQKPSDWSKHIQEDVAPFICTFPNCPEPKSFKRKADWVRHENERHRQLEWWQCNKEGCTHVCFRRDNFVQHLVREHKMAEPKPKVSSSTPTRGPERVTSSKHSAEEQVIKMVDACRRETDKSSAEEPCRFCGNRCNSFKKLTVHLARHMETISLPILDLVSRFDVTSGSIDTSSFNLPAASPPLLAPASEAASAPVQPPTHMRAESPINVIVPAHRPPPPQPQSLTPSTPPEPKDVSMTEAPTSNPPVPVAASAAPVPTPVPTPAPPTAEKGREKTYRCEVAGCTHDRSFASQNDLNRHMKGVHGIYQGGSDPRFFRCQGQDCSKESKIWPRLDNFRGHIARMHPDEDVEELIRRSGFTTTDGLPPGADAETKQESDKDKMEVVELAKEQEAPAVPAAPAAPAVPTVPAAPAVPAAPVALPDTQQSNVPAV